MAERPEIQVICQALKTVFLLPHLVTFHFYPSVPPAPWAPAHHFASPAAGVSAATDTAGSLH